MVGSFQQEWNGFNSFQRLLEHYGVDASKHYIGYPEDELEESSSYSSEEETEGVIALGTQ